jgi:threonine dehydrogenase-like Zn-dependent dehydrogenase
MPTDVAVFTEPVAAAFQIPSQMTIHRHDRIVVLGDDRLGNLCAQVLANLSKNVTVVGKHEEKLAHIPVSRRHVHGDPVRPHLL